MNDKLQLIREKCIAANPKIETINDCSCRFCSKDNHQTIKLFGRPLRLADVLLVIQIKNNEQYKDERALYATRGDVHLVVTFWDLHNDDLEQQSEETINFLYELLK